MGKAGNGTDDLWCILRTSGGRTLPLVRSLSAAGFDVWTPTQLIERRRGRSRERKEVAAPILPTFVFARARHLQDLVVAQADPVSAHPPFSIFIHAGRAPLVSGGGKRGLASLRAEEAAARDRAARRARKLASRERCEIPVGESVRVKEETNFLGLTGVVESCNGRHAVVNFGGLRTVKIEAWRLATNAIQTEIKAA